ncbi:hypothetical protein D3C86_1272740 [compost metagenome]
MRGGENGERDAGEIDNIGAFDRFAQMIRVRGQLSCRGGVAPVAEGALAVLQVDEVKAGCATLDTTDFFRADAGIGNEGQHVFRKRIVAECGEIIDRPVFRQAGAGIPGGIERIARKTLAQQPIAGLRQFHHAFANRQKPSAHAVILPFFPAMRLTTSARR